MFGLFQKKLHAFAILLLVVGGLNMGSMVFFKKGAISMVFGKSAFLANLLFLLIGVSALSIALFRDSYLPFLGQTVLPCSLLHPQSPVDSDTELQISARPGSKVLYWAAEPANHGLQFIQNWKQAYGDFGNAGVTLANELGAATLRIRKPQTYTVPIFGTLAPHVHYRVCEQHGFVGPVQTVTLEDESFDNPVAAQEDNAPVVHPPPAPLPPQPESALDVLNRLARKTMDNSHMVETGALDEFRPQKGASLEYAFS
jgi:uncharacterized membrane protein YuzA (DUF378 family)